MDRINAPSARKCAVELLVQILDEKRPFDEAVSRHAGLQALAERDRNFARLMVMTCLRRLGQTDALIDQLLEKKLQGKSNIIMHCLRLGVVQLIWLETPPHAAVHAMVETVEEMGFERMKGLVNAILKRVAKEGAEKVAAQDEALINTPRWLYDSWMEAYGKDTARAIAIARLAEPPLDITVLGNEGQWAERLKATLLPTGSLRLAQAGRVDRLEGYAQGAWWVQDAAAALPARLLGDIRGKDVLDLCAAPGGKTAQLAAAGGFVTAVDHSARRLQILQENMHRLNLPVRAVQADIIEWKPDRLVDAILLDAPCSATGTLRRHPEVVWHRSKEDIARLVTLQKRLLTRAAKWLKPGGRIVYCVCSLQPEEGEKQMAAFLASHPEFAVLPATGLPEPFVTAQGAIRTHPALMAELGGLDGFYAISLQRLNNL